MKRNDFTLFSESNSRFLVEVVEKRQQDFETLMGGNDFSVVGRVKKSFQRGVRDRIHRWRLPSCWIA
jgi:hypothetical protein